MNYVAERAVQTFKKFMKKSTNGSIKAYVSHFLLQYQITLQTSTGISLMRRCPRSRLDLQIPDMVSKMQHKQQNQKHHHDKRKSQREKLLRRRQLHTGKICHFLLQEISRNHRIAQTSFKITLSMKFQLFLCISYYRIGHNFIDSFLDISSAIFITCCVPKTYKESLVYKNSPT